ncbi:MAG: hypothetical protein Q4C96_04900, partial [Planctomycetia bacterium]|nr:hypothetical protein [Planctomycetia bacterium]
IRDYGLRPPSTAPQKNQNMAKRPSALHPGLRTASSVHGSTVKIETWAGRHSAHHFRDYGLTSSVHGSTGKNRNVRRNVRRHFIRDYGLRPPSTAPRENQNVTERPSALPF